MHLRMNSVLRNLLLIMITDMACNIILHTPSLQFRLLMTHFDDQHLDKNCQLKILLQNMSRDILCLFINMSGYF